MKCIFCNAEVSPSWKFCSRCGESQGEPVLEFEKLGGIKPTGCIKCGCQYQKNDAFCTECGWYVKDHRYIDDGLIIAISLHGRVLYPRADLPRMVTDVTELWEYFLLLMRHSDSQQVFQACFELIQSALASPLMTEDLLDQLAVLSADNVCKAAAWASYIDHNLLKYFGTVVSSLFSRLADRNRRVILILDNSMDQLRLRTVEITFTACGFGVISPTENGRKRDFNNIIADVTTYMSERKNIIYIEPDAFVNNIEIMLQATKDLPGYLQTFRNQPPDFASMASYIPKNRA